MQYLITGLVSAITTIAQGIMGFFMYDFWTDLAIAKVNTSTGKLFSVGLIFDEYLPGVGGTSMKTIFKTIGLTIVFLLLLLNLAKAFLPQEASRTIQHPFESVARAIAAGFAVMNAYIIMAVIQSPMAYIYQSIQQTAKNASSNPNSGLASDFTLVSLVPITKPDNILQWLNNEAAATTVAVINLFIILAITWAFIQLIAEFVERYVIMCFLFYASPVGLSAYASSSTQSVASSYIRMIFSQYLLMMFNLCFIYVFCYAFSHQNHADIQLEQQRIIYYLVLLAWLKLGRSLDEHMRTLGLSAAQTGRGIAAEAMIAGAMAVRTVQSIAKGVGNARQSSSPNSGGGAPLSGKDVYASSRTEAMSHAQHVKANTNAGESSFNALSGSPEIARALAQEGLSGSGDAVKAASLLTGIPPEKMTSATIPPDFASKGFVVKGQDGCDYKIQPVADNTKASLHAAGVTDDIMSSTFTSGPNGEYTWAMTAGANNTEAYMSSEGLIGSEQWVGHDALGSALGVSAADQDAVNGVGCFNMTSDSSFASKYGVPEGNYVAFDTETYQAPGADTNTHHATINGRNITFVSSDAGYTPEFKPITYSVPSSGVEGLANKLGVETSGGTGYAPQGGGGVPKNSHINHGRKSNVKHK